MSAGRHISQFLQDLLEKCIKVKVCECCYLQLLKMYNADCRSKANKKRNKLKQIFGTQRTPV
uniref:Uncharacterized protein n=1 Tax=Arion vulgaris TaxID=1028688 RepID=A0A0B6Z4Z5_9EUPU